MPPHAVKAPTTTGKAAKDTKGKKNLELKYTLFKCYENSGNEDEAISILKDILSYDENVNVNNFIDALSEIKGEQVKVADDEIASLLRPIKRFYNYTDRVPYEIVKDDVEEAEDMIGDLTDSPID